MSCAEFERALRFTQDSRGAARTTLAYAERHQGTAGRAEVCHRSDVPPPAAPTFEQWVVHRVASVRAGMVHRDGAIKRAIYEANAAVVGARFAAFYTHSSDGI